MTYEDALRKIVLNDDRYVVMTSENRGPIRSLCHELDGRFVDVGIMEQGLVGMAAGLALRGRIPILHCLACFMTMRAFEFIRTDVGLPALPVKLMGTIPGFLSEMNGPTHQAVEDVALMRSIPNMNVFTPADNEDLIEALPEVLISPEPWYVRFNTLERQISHEPFMAGKAEVFGHGTDAAIIVSGMLLHEAISAQKILAVKGIDIRVIHLRTVKPLDDAVIRSAATECSTLVTLEDHLQVGGLFSVVGELLAGCSLSSETRVIPYALNERWFKPLPLPKLLDYEAFSGEKIAVKLEGWIK